MPTPYDFIWNLMQGGMDPQMQTDINAQRGRVSALGTNVGSFAPGQQAFSALMGFNPEMSGAVRGGLENVISNPLSKIGRGTLNEMLGTGAPVDVSPIGEAASRQANSAFEQLTGGAREQAAMRGGLSGSGFANKQAQIGGQLADQIQSQMLRAGVGAQEAAQGRRMGALGVDLGAQGLSANAASQLGGLEGLFSGQRLGALGQAAGAEGQMNAQTLQHILGSAGLNLQGDIAQAGAGQGFLDFMKTMGSQGGPGMTGPNALQFAQSVMRGTGETQNALDVSRMQQLMSLQPSTPGGGGSALSTFMGNYASNPTSGSAPRAGASASPYVGSSAPSSYGPPAGMGGLATGMASGAQGTGTAGDAGGYTPPSFTPPGQPLEAVAKQNAVTDAQLGKSPSALPSKSAPVTDWDAFSRAINALMGRG